MEPSSAVIYLSAQVFAGESCFFWRYRPPLGNGVCTSLCPQGKMQETLYSLIVMFFVSRKRKSRVRTPTARFSSESRADDILRCPALIGQALEERRLLAFGGELVLETVTADLSAPVVATHAGDGSGRLFVAEQQGTIRIVQNGVLQPTPFLDIRGPVLDGGERGLLGLAFHPDYDTPDADGEGKFYVYYSAPAAGTGNHDSIVAEYRVSAADPNVADPDSERILLRFTQPFSNHNGGELKFGPDDGYLYISSGDGGSGGDPQNNAQNLSTLLGKILRIDVNANDAPGGQYGIPVSNPFVGQENVRPEIFAYGFRNPFRMSFDDGPLEAASPDRLFVGDVGQGSWEEVDLVHAGGNYGWRIREGAHPFNTSDPNPGNLIDPIAEYPHPLGNAVIGGFVYRGEDFPSLVGHYVFGDLSGRMFTLEESAGGWELSEPNVMGGNPIGDNILAFGEDEAGELYVMTFDSLRRITVNESVPDFPWRNGVLPEDVNGNGQVEITDLIAMLQFLRENGFIDLPEPNEELAPPPFVDPTGDRRATIEDLLAVVEFLRDQQSSGLAEAEEEGPSNGALDEIFAELPL
jgi:glucose/arabinose dehydrogenase